MRSYPAVLIFTAYGLGLVRARRWDDLHRFFSAEICRQHGEPLRVVNRLFLWSWEGGENNVWQTLEGLDGRKTALSDHLLDLFVPWSASFAGVVPDFESLFERYEILASLAYLEEAELTEIDQALASQGPQSWIWIPVGRSGWHTSTRERVFHEMRSPDVLSALLQAGFANGSEEYFAKAIENYTRISGRMRWWT
jgi:hypothetical protein